MLVTAAELLPHCTPLARGETFKALSSDSADHSCQVVLRSAQIVLNSVTGLPETETDNAGRSWFAFEATVDTASAPSNLGHQFNFCTAASATQPGTQLLQLRFPEPRQLCKGTNFEFLTIQSLRDLEISPLFPRIQNLFRSFRFCKALMGEEFSTTIHKQASPRLTLSVLQTIGKQQLSRHFVKEPGAAQQL